VALTSFEMEPLLTVLPCSGQAQGGAAFSASVTAPD
jgi:hypothetical protein